MSFIKKISSVLVLTFSMNIFVLLILNLFAQDFSSSKTVLNNSSDDLLLKTLVILFITPFLEEIIFRLGIILNYKLNSFFLASAFFVLALDFFVVTKITVLKLVLIAIFVYLFFVFFLKFLYAKIEVEEKKIVLFFSILSIIFFVISHLKNFDSYEGLIFYLLVFHIFLDGLIYTHIRLKYGIFFSIFAHYSYNFVDFLFTHYSLYYLF